MDDYDQQRYEALLADLDALLQKHGLTLSSSGYDHLQVWIKDDRDADWHDWIENRIDKKV